MESEAPKDSESAGAADMAGTEDRIRQMLDTSCVVFDNGSESLTPLKLWSTALKKYKILEACEAIYENPGTDDAEKASANQDEMLALGEAGHALTALA